MSAAISAEELQAMVDGHAFLAPYGMRVREVERGRCLVEIPFRAEFERPGGVIPGPIYMGVADATMWLAIYTVLGAAARLSVTTDMRTAFLSGLRGEAFVCDARVLDIGPTLIFGTAACSSLRGDIMTHHALTYIVPPPTSSGS
jgi:acyl-coenzyme A thioesterase PaaI-like protein